MSQIIAVGGGLPSGGVESKLGRYVLEASGAPRPRVALLLTASGEDPGYTIRAYSAFADMGARPTHFSFFKPHTADLRGYFLEQDVIYVGGGNTKSMLALWRGWGVDTILREAWEQGVVLTGPSAGMICWFEQGITDSIPGDLTALDCLGWLPGCACPHYHGEAKRIPAFHSLLAAGTIHNGWAADDGVGLHFRGTALAEVVTEIDGATAYRLEKVAGKVVETPLPARLL